MTFTFAPYQLAEIAMDIEESGAAYYLELSKRTSDEHAQKVFLFLAEQEKQHKQSFEIVMEQSKKTEDEGEYIIDLLSQMRTIAKDITTTIQKFLSNNSNTIQLSQAFDVGIQTEKKSIEAYTLMKNQLIDIFAATLENILHQEEGHLVVLMDLKAKSIA